MKTKGKTPVRPTPREIAAQIGTLIAESNAVRRRLHRLLLDGHDTRAARAEILAFEERIHEIRCAGDQIAAQRDLEVATSVKRAATDIVAEELERIGALLTSRQPPQHPTGEGSRS
jgi:hypothetical protein